MSKLVFEKLSDTNYAEWSMQMEALLEEQDLWDVVSGVETRPLFGPNSKQVKAFVRKQRLARAKIILHLSTSQLPHARVEDGDPKAIWDNLAHIHQSRGFGRIFSMLRELSTMVKTYEQPMQAWVASVQDLSFRLKSAGFDVDSTIIIVTLLRGLPSEYSPLITTIGATPLDDLTISSVVNQMLNEESRHQQSTTEPGVAMRSSQPSSQRNQTRHEDKPTKSVMCYNCRGRGHVAKDCPSPHMDLEPESKGHSKKRANQAVHSRANSTSSDTSHSSY